MESSQLPASRNPQLPALTGLRFFAALFILIAHACDWCAQFQNSEIRSYFGLVAMYGMPLFFVLSGFVIHYNYAGLFDRQPLARAISEFGVARLARLFPLYLFLLTVAMLADGFIPEAKKNHALWKDLGLHFLTLTQSWVYKFWDGKLMATSLFPLAWSISTEWFFYLAYIGLVFPILWMRRLNVTLVVCVLYAVMAFALLWRGDPSRPNYRWLYYFSPYVRVFEFGMGCLAAHLFKLMRGREVSRGERVLGWWMLATSLLFLAAVYPVRAALVVWPPLNGIVNHLSNNFLLAPAIAVVIFCSCRYETGFSKFVSRPALVRLGETSYSIYLTQSWTLRIFTHAPPKLSAFWAAEAILRVIVAIAVTLVVSYGTYHLLEVPSRAWVRSFFFKPRVGSNLTLADNVASSQPQA